MKSNLQKMVDRILDVLEEYQAFITNPLSQPMLRREIATKVSEVVKPFVAQAKEKTSPCQPTAKKSSKK